jgi:hypothetical protein
MPPPPPPRPQQSGKTVKDLDHALNYETCLRTTIRQRPFSWSTLLFLLTYLCKLLDTVKDLNLIGLKGRCHVTHWPTICATQLLHTVPLHKANDPFMSKSYIKSHDTLLFIRLVYVTEITLWHVSKLAGLYALINNAGVCVCGEFDWQTWDHINSQIEVISAMPGSASAGSSTGKTWDHINSPNLGNINNAGVCVCGEFDWQTWDHINSQIEVISAMLESASAGSSTGKRWTA